MVAWTTTAMVAASLGPGVGDQFLADPIASQVVDASNVVCFRKRAAAGYADDPAAGAPAPDPAVAQGATLYATALYRERASTDGFASFEDIAAFTPTGGSWGQIKRLLGIGKSMVDSPLTAEQLSVFRRGRYATYRLRW